MTAKTLIQALAPAFVLLAILLCFMVFYKLLGLPSSEDLVVISKEYLARYGYLIVFVAAFVETIPPVNFYLPGSAVIVFSVAYSRSGGLSVFGVLSVATVAFLLAYVIDYYIGMFGWHRLLERCGFKSSLSHARQKVSAYGLKWLWLAAVHPNLGSLAATSCGVLRVPFTPFLLHLLGAQIVWTTFWGSAAYFGANAVFALTNAKWAILLIVGYIVFKFIRLMRTKDENDKLKTKKP